MTARGRRANLEPGRAARAALTGQVAEPELVAALGRLGMAQVEGLTKFVPSSFVEQMYQRASRGGRVDETQLAELDAARALVLRAIVRDQQEAA